MRVLKNILIGFGVLFLVGIALFAWVGVSSSQFRKEQAAFVGTFVTDLSKRWDTADVHDRLADSLIEQASSPQTQSLMHQFKELGRLRSVHDLELKSYVSTNKGQRGTFSFKGAFENGEGVVDVTIIKKDGAVRVSGFRLNGIHTRNEVSKLQT
jgi:hypothetical protein